MNYSDNIGIAVSGCKNGFSVLSCSTNVDTSGFQVRAALKDMREYLRISTPLKDFYSIEFTDAWRVCSIYRSSIDSAGASGAYIAITLFVPHNIEVRGMSLILKQMMDTYFAEYMHSLFGSPLPGKLESIEPLRSVLRAHEGNITLMRTHYKVSPSKSSELPLYIPAADSSIVDKVFDNPYHNRYTEASKVIIMSQDMLDNPAASQISFNTDVTRINAILTPSASRIHRMRPLMQPGCRILSFRLNGTEIAESYTTVSFSDNDNLDISLALPDGSSLTLAGTLHKLLDDRAILRQGDDYAFSRFRYSVPVNITGIETNLPPHAVIIPSLMASDGSIFPIDQRTGTCNISSVASSFSLVLGSADNHYIISRDFFVPGNTRLPLAIPFHSYNVKMRQNMPLNVELLEMGRRRYSFNPYVQDTSVQFALPEVVPSSAIAYVSRGQRLGIDSSGTILPAVKSVQTQNRKKDSLPPWIYIVAGSLGAILICIAVWWFFLRPAPKTNTPNSDTVAEAKQTTITTIEIPAYLAGQMPDSLAFKGFPDSVKYSVDRDNNIVITVDSRKDTTKFNQETLQVVTFIKSKRATTINVNELLTEADFADLMNYPKNKKLKFVLRHKEPEFIETPKPDDDFDYREYLSEEEIKELKRQDEEFKKKYMKDTKENKSKDNISKPANTKGKSSSQNLDDEFKRLSDELKSTRVNAGTIRKIVTFTDNHPDFKGRIPQKKLNQYESYFKSGYTNDANISMFTDDQKKLAKEGKL